MLELLVQLYRLNDVDRVNQLYSLFSTFPNLHWIEPSLDVADRAAHLRGTLHLKTPDALQAATALGAGNRVHFQRCFIEESERFGCAHSR